MDQECIEEQTRSSRIREPMKRTKSSGKKISVASISLNLYYRALSTHNNEMLNHMRLQELAEFREDIRL